jgi:hypothetical protein
VSYNPEQDENEQQTIRKAMNDVRAAAGLPYLIEGGDSRHDAPCGCPVRWGNCTGLLETATAFGKPTATPHVCASGRGHQIKLHACAVCDVVGAVTKPLPFTRAGKLYLKMLAHADAQRKAERFSEANVILESPPCQNFSGVKA